MGTNGQHANMHSLIPVQRHSDPSLTATFMEREQKETMPSFQVSTKKRKNINLSPSPTTRLLPFSPFNPSIVKLWGALFLKEH